VVHKCIKKFRICIRVKSIDLNINSYEINIIYSISYSKSIEFVITPKFYNTLVSSEQNNIKLISYMIEF